MAFNTDEIKQHHKLHTNKIYRLRERIHAKIDDTVKKAEQPLIRLSECVVKRKRLRTE